MVATSTVEQYLKTMFLLERKTGATCIPMKTLADGMGVTPGTATAMAKHLAAQGLIDYLPRRGTILNDEGRAVAIKMVRRHRLIETFLERVLEYDWSEVHSDAEELEHVVSDRFIERIDHLLGYPEADPHGDPIPRADGAFASQTLISLTDAAAGQDLVVARIVDDSDAFLQLMKDKRIVPGEVLRLVENNPVAGTVTVEHAALKGTSLALGHDMAQSILVREPASS
ncbi:MAG: metal-dependent transcriptional regulator [Spirochaetales bacterium]|nr:metal-dependent transcriptional regulator [Spirochaetales bacterium]